MKREIPLAIVLVLGIIMIFQYFIPSAPSQKFFEYVQDFLRVAGVPALVLGVVSITLVHWNKIKRKAPNWQYSIVTIFALYATAIIGFSWGTEARTPFMFIFNYIQIPITSTMFSLLAFYMASAAYRAFRARSTQATILLLAAFIVMIGRVSIWTYLPESIGHVFPTVTEWLMAVPNMAAKRGILLGVGLGMISTSVKIILGIERSYLGR